MDLSNVVSTPSLWASLGFFTAWWLASKMGNVPVERVRILHVTQTQRTCIITSFMLYWVEQSQNPTHLHGVGHRPCHSIARVSVNHIVKRAESKICPKDHVSFFFVSQHLSSQWKATDAQSVHFLNCIKLSKFDI